MITLPTPTGDAEDSQAEGLVVDREKGILYIGMEGEVGVVTTSALPDGGTEIQSSQVILSIDEDYIMPDIEGLAIYYAGNGEGYLLVSSQGDSSIVVLDKNTYEYLGSFAVGDTKKRSAAIDQVNESDGFDVLNVNLGYKFEHGLMVIQDGANDPQEVVPDEEELENASNNFKYVSWKDIATKLNLTVDTSSDPRQFNSKIAVPGGLL